MKRIGDARRCKAYPKMTGASCPPPSGVRIALRSFKDVVQDYINQYRAKANDELSFFRKVNSLDEAIEKAANAEGEDGKKYGHQWRIPPATLGRAAKALLTVGAQISNCTSFESLIELVEATAGRIEGFGELAIYDTTLRIGAWFGVEPKYVYLHRGTRKGAKALGLASHRKCLEVTELPGEFAKLKPREIEDCLCIYTEVLSRLRRA